MEPEPDGPLMEGPRAARALALLLFLTAAGFSLGYRALVLGDLGQSAAMFVGLPVLLAVLTLALVNPRTVIGTSVMVATLALLLSAIVFQEGFLCILFTAPLFYGVAIGVAVVYDYARGERGGPRAFVIAVLPMLLLGSEGVFFSMPREQSATAVAIVAATPSEVRAALSDAPDLQLPLPGLLQLGFPRPVAASGSGLDVGAERRVRFAGGEGAPGEMVLQVQESTPERIRFALVEDGSHLAHWLDWRGSVVRLRQVPGGTEVSWTVHYTRHLDPAWYFDPLQHLAVQSAADWLIRSTATPR